VKEDIMKLKNFVKLIDEKQSLIITDELGVSFILDFSEKSFQNNYWQGNLSGKAYKDSEVIACYAREENVLVVVVVVS